jgi:hypothetical protein
MSDFTKKRLEKSQKQSWPRPIPQISDEEIIANLIWSKHGRRLSCDKGRSSNR